MLLLRHSRRVFCGVGKGVGSGEQSDSRSADDFDRSSRPTAEPSGSIMPPDLGVGDLSVVGDLSGVGRGQRKHVVISFPVEGQRGPTDHNNADIVLAD
jgi:hypothetical protein